MWFQIWHEEFGEFSPNHSKVQKFHSEGLFLSKVYEAWAKKIQRSYLSWQRTVMQNLKNPDLVVSEIAWGNGWTFIIRATKSLKIVHWRALFVQSINCFSQKLSEELCVMTLKGVAKFKRKLTYGLKNDIRNLDNFHASCWKSKNLHFDWIRLSKAQSIKIFRWKSTKELCLMTLNSDVKFEKPWPCGFKNGMRNWVNFHH